MERTGTPTWEDEAASFEAEFSEEELAAQALANNQRLRTHCVVEGRPLTLDEFEAAHPRIMLGAE